MKNNEEYDPKHNSGVIKMTTGRIKEDIIRVKYTLFCMTIMVVGIVYSYLVKPFEISDEGTHFYTAYMIADQLQGKRVIKSGEDYLGVKGITPVTMEIRSADKPLFYLETDMIVYSVKDQGIFVKEAKWESISVCVATYSIFPTYLIDALALIVGMKVKLSCLGLVYLLRYVNLTFYAAVGLLSVKLMPLSKELVCVVFNLPFAIQRAASCSYDGLFFAFVWFYVCLILHYKFREVPMGYRDMLILTVVSFLLAPIKGMCIVLIAMVLLIPRSKFNHRTQCSVFRFLNLVGGTGIWLLYNLTSTYAGDLLSNNNERFIDYSQTDSVNLIELFGHPLYYAKIVLHTFIKRFTFYPAEMAPQNIDIGSLAVVGFCMLLFVSLLKSKENRSLERADKAKCGLIYLGSYALVCVLTIVSWGGREALLAPIKVSYTLPFLLLLNIILINNRMRYTGDNKWWMITVGNILFHGIGILHVCLF